MDPVRVLDPVFDRRLVEAVKTSSAREINPEGPLGKRILFADALWLYKIMCAANGYPVKDADVTELRKEFGL